MMTIDEAITFLQAYKEGKTLEYFNPCNNKWMEIKNEDSLLRRITDIGEILRIKKEPVYEPYSDNKEFLQAMKEHGPFLKRLVNVPDPDKHYDTYVMPLTIRGAWVDFKSAVAYDGNSETETTICNMLGKYEWQDGTPCGILK